MILRLRFVALAGVAAAMAVPASATVLIDDFTQGATDLQIASGTGSVESQQSGINVPGGQRDVMLKVISNPFNRLGRFEIVPTQGMSFYSSGPGLVGQVGLDYDGAETENLTDGQLTAGPGMNLNLSNENRFRFNFSFVDLATVLHIDAYTNGGGSSSVDFNVSSGITSSTLVDVPFSSFSATSGGGVNFSDVDRIVILFNNANAATDFALGSINAVPEPASMAALAVGALGLLARRRRK
jgi:hypothetical protein